MFAISNIFNWLIPTRATVPTFVVLFGSWTSFPFRNNGRGPRPTLRGWTVHLGRRQSNY